MAESHQRAVPEFPAHRRRRWVTRIDRFETETGNIYQLIKAAAAECPDCNTSTGSYRRPLFSPRDALWHPRCIFHLRDDDSHMRDRFLTRMKYSSVNRTNNITK